MRKQTCNNCIAFDDYRKNCKLQNLIIEEKVGEITNFHPITKCNKPRTKREFFFQIKKLKSSGNFELLSFHPRSMVLCDQLPSRLYQNVHYILHKCHFASDKLSVLLYR